MGADEGAVARDQVAQFHFTRGRLVAYIILVWVSGLLASTGVSYIAAGIASDRSNHALQRVLVLQDEQGSNGLQLIYESDLTRCRASASNRKVVIANAEHEKEFYDFLRQTPGDIRPEVLARLPLVVVPTSLPPCSQTVKNPAQLRATVTRDPTGPVSATG